MEFSVISWPPFIFICIITVLAILGNVCVLLVYLLRWRTTNDTKVYIVMLAVLDLACVLLSAPRELLSFVEMESNSACLIEKSQGMQWFCRITVLGTYHLNLTSAFILVAIAISRCVKTMKRDLNITGQSGVKAVLYAVSTAHGAKSASVVALVVALVLTWPVLVLYGTADLPSAQGDFNASNLINSSIPAEGDTTSCFETCVKEIHPDFIYRYARPYSTFQFVNFLLIALALIVTYSAILHHLCKRKKNGDSDHWAGGDSSEVFSDFAKSASRHDLRDQATGESEPPLKLQRLTCDATPGDETNTVAECAVKESGTEPGRSPSPTNTPLNKTEENRAETSHTLSPQPTLQSPKLGSESNENDSLPFSPVSYSAQLLSDMSAVRRSTSANKEVVGLRLSALSTVSFQLKKTGNRAWLTTLVFFLVTLVYCASYLPFFVVALRGYFYEPKYLLNAGASIQIASKSFLIANAANPLVYGLCNPYFREELGKLLVCRRNII